MLFSSLKSTFRKRSLLRKSVAMKYSQRSNGSQRISGKRDRTSRLRLKRNSNKMKTESKSLRDKLRSKNVTTTSETKKSITRWMKSRCRARLSVRSCVTYTRRNCWPRSVSLRRRCTLITSVTRSCCTSRTNKKRSLDKSCPSCTWFRKNSTKRLG